MVSITVRNLIDAIVSLIWTFQYLAHLAEKRILTSPKWGFKA